MEECEFTIQDIVPIAITFVVITIVLSYGAVIVTNVRTGTLPAVETATCNATGSVFTGCNYAYNISTSGLSGLNNFGTNLPLLATIVVAAIIITILVVYLGGRLMG